jgi:hypothetical protein
MIKAIQNNKVLNVAVKNLVIVGFYVMYLLLREAEVTSAPL